MNFLTAYMKGWARALALPHIALIKWLHNLLFAAMLTVPFAGLLQNDLDHSLSADRLLQTVPYDIYTEFTIHHDGAFSSIHLALMSGVIVFMLLAWFLAGGTLGALSAERRPTTAEFFADCAKYFWSMSWVTIVSFLFGGLVLVLFYGAWSGRWLASRSGLRAQNFPSGSPGRFTRYSLCWRPLYCGWPITPAWLWFLVSHAELCLHLSKGWHSPGENPYPHWRCGSQVWEWSLRW